MHASPETVPGSWERYSAKRLVLPILVIVVIAFLPGPLLMFYWFVRDLAAHGIPEVGKLVMPLALFSAYALGFVLLMFYVVLASLRIMIFPDGVQVLTWRGKQMYLWKDARRAKITILKGTATLVLNFGGLRRARICLGDYRNSRSLFEFIRSRLPVPVRANEFQLALIHDS